MKTHKFLSTKESFKLKTKIHVFGRKKLENILSEKYYFSITKQQNSMTNKISYILESHPK